MLFEVFSISLLHYPQSDGLTLIPTILTSEWDKGFPVLSAGAAN